MYMYIDLNVGCVCVLTNTMFLDLKTRLNLQGGMDSTENLIQFGGFGNYRSNIRPPNDQGHPQQLLWCPLQDSNTKFPHSSAPFKRKLLCPF